MDPNKYNLVDIKLGIEMLVSVLPLHEPADVEKLTGLFAGIEWGKAAGAMGVDIWQAILRGGPDAVDTLDQYFDFFLELIAYMRGERKELPEAVARNPKMVQAVTNRRRVIEVALKKK